MDGSSSSLSEEKSSEQLSLPEETNKDRSALCSGHVVERLLSGEEQLTLITESMSITSADQEKLQLLNKNTELRKLNKELMKLNEDWDHIYRSTSVGLQQRVAALEQEILALKQLNSRLLIKVEHEQNKREYYEHTLMQELKKNQHLQEYIRLLESRLQHTDTLKYWALGTQNMSAGVGQPEVHVMERSAKSFTPSATSSEHHPKMRSQSHEKKNDASKEVQDLKEQLHALRYQTKIYEADYKIEHRDHELMLQENKRLRRREGEMRQQMALLQEQLKVYEDDFQKERTDKQLLQRMLMKKAPAVHEPPPIRHRNNNDHERVIRERRRTREEHKAVLCPKHLEFP